MTPAEQKAFAELAKFAAARSRGATVLVNAPNGQPVKYPSDDYGCGRQFNAMAIVDGWRIKEIIEPTVLREWTAEDAMKHLGWSIRHTQARQHIATISTWHNQPNNAFTGSEYALPQIGTDPAKWDWKPCKVEVPVEAPAAFDLRNAMRGYAEYLRSTADSTAHTTRRILRDIEEILGQS